MCFKKAILLLLALQICITVQAQPSCTSSFRGQVLDQRGSPLSGAAVFISPGNRGEITNANGEFSFSGLCDGIYTVRLQYVGYVETSATIAVSDDDVRRIFTLEEQVTELEEVTIQHHDPAGTEHATNFSGLSERELAEAAGKTLGETLREIPGVTALQTGPGIFKPVIHGVHSQRLLILNHGIRQEGQQWGAEHAPELDPFIASSIVVIKDASAIKYGSDALGGVIVVNPAPLPETNTPGGTLASVFQSNGRSATVSGMLEGGIKNADGWGWRIQSTARRAGDFRTPDYVLTNTGIKELNFSASTGYHTRNSGFDFFFSRFNSEIGILRGTAIGNLDDLVNAMERDVPLYTADFSYAIKSPRQEVSHNLLKVNGHIRGEEGELRIQYGFQNNNRREFDLRIGDLSRIPAMDLRLNTHSADLEWETHHSEFRTFSVGMNMLYQTNRNIPGTQRIPFIPDFNNATGGLFATSKFFFPKWTVDAGIRYDLRKYAVRGFDFKNSFYSSSFNFGNASASLGITWSMIADQALKFSVSTAWRPPHVSELYSVGTHQSAAAVEYGLMLDPASNEVRDVDDVRLSPEQAVKAVVSYEVNSGDLCITVTPYVNYILNYIYLRPGGITRTLRGVYPYFRYDQTVARFMGADLHATFNLRQYLAAGTRISLLRADDMTNDDNFLFIPSNRFSLDLRYEKPVMFGFSHVYLESRAQYVARQMYAPRVVTVREIKESEERGDDPFSGDASIFDFAETPDGYFIWTAAAGFSINSDKVQYDFRCGVENLLNERYREYTNRFRYYADDPGRNLVLSVKCIF